MMSKRSEIYKYELKLERMERKSWRKAKKLVRKEGIKLAKWLFFYKYDSMGDAILHIVDVLAILYLATRLVGR
jgi:hypothetical protein